MLDIIERMKKASVALVSVMDKIDTSGAATRASIGLGFLIFEKNSTNAARPVATLGLCWM